MPPRADLFSLFICWFVCEQNDAKTCRRNLPSKLVISSLRNDDILDRQLCLERVPSRGQEDEVFDGRLDTARPNRA